jgi:site-specific DNA recombinase
VSSADQVTNGFGLDAQRQAITAYATAQGWDLVGIQEDQGTSGTYGVADSNRDGNPRRPGLVAVLDALEAGQADSLIVRALDRIGRAPAVCADVFSRIDRARATFASITEPALSSDLLRGLFAGMASDERRRILERTREGRLQKIAQGGPVGSVPFGYRLVGSRRAARVEIHEPEAVIVRRIHALRASGHTMQAITAILNDEGIPAPRGGIWRQSTVGKIAINPAYSGTFHWGTVRRLPDGQLSDGAELVTLPDVIPAIVPAAG